MLAPQDVGIPKALDVDPTREPSFDRCLDERRSEEGKREGEVDLAHRASLSLCQVFGVDDGSADDFIKPNAVTQPG